MVSPSGTGKLGIRNWPKGSFISTISAMARVRRMASRLSGKRAAISEADFR